MFTCVMCKRDREDEPAMTNGVGSFCPECKDVMHRRSMAGTGKSPQAMRRRQEPDIYRRSTSDGVCCYCGSGLSASEQNRSGGGGNGHVCNRCANWRKWARQCVRYSDKLIRYTTNLEAREQPKRDERLAAQRMQAAEVAEAAVCVQRNLGIEAVAEPELLTRLGKLEGMVGRLLRDLGSDPEDA